MNLAPHDAERLIHEHLALLRHCASTQARCSALLARQAAEIEMLQARAIRQQAAVVVRDTALAWAREDRVALEASIPGLPRRAALSRRVEALMGRIQQLMGERRSRQRPADVSPPQPHRGPADRQEMAALEASLVAADLVICQTGCLSHGDYWRVQDHCKRTGKACVMVERPDSLRIVRIVQTT
ncbi:DUF2325 domain-containing protein [Xylophilus sp. Kf1]|nr:DUF2325 domain-containing protein [Xylophilus sp. Kf1]